MITQRRQDIKLSIYFQENMTKHDHRDRELSMIKTKQAARVITMKLQRPRGGENAESE